MPSAVTQLRPKHPWPVRVELEPLFHCRYSLAGLIAGRAEYKSGICGGLYTEVSISSAGYSCGRCLGPLPCGKGDRPSLGVGYFPCNGSVFVQTYYQCKCPPLHRPTLPAQKTIPRKKINPPLSYFPPHSDQNADTNFPVRPTSLHPRNYTKEPSSTSDPVQQVLSQNQKSKRSARQISIRLKSSLMMGRNLHLAVHGLIIVLPFVMVFVHKDIIYISDKLKRPTLCRCITTLNHQIYHHTKSTPKTIHPLAAARSTYNMTPAPKLSKDISLT
jgi:hypothetical protein